MSSSSPSSQSKEPTLDERIRMTSSFQSFLHNASLFMLVTSPILIAIPPRKLDLYTLSLTGAFIASANQLVKERTGAGLLHQLPGVSSPASKAREHQERIRAQEQRKRLLDESGASTTSVQEQLDKRGLAEHRQPGVLETAARDVWMGEEKEGWKEKRLKEERRKLAEGEGYGSMILDQIWEVWTWGEHKAEEVKQKDEKVLKQDEHDRKREQEFPQIGRKG